MAKLTQDQVNIINEVIAEIEKAMKPTNEIGARDKSVLTGLLAANKIDKKPAFFKCKREHSNDIVAHFMKNKGLKRNKFHMNAQTAIYLI